MKILELTRSFYPSIGGMEKFVADRLKIYESLNFDYHVITTTHSEKKLPYASNLSNVNYLPSYTPYEVVPSLTRHMKKLEYDIMSLNQLTYYYSLQAVNSAFDNGKKIILTPHLYFHTNKFKVIKLLHNNIIVPKVLKKVTKIVCFTEYETEYWKSNFPEVENKIVVIPHYFAFAEPKFSPPKNNFGKFFLFLGRGERNKRIDLLIEAFNNINSNYNLVLTVSEDEIKTDLKNLIRNNKRIHLLGRVSEKEKQNLLANCEALILATDYEAFGIVNFEASFYKKPLLLTELDVFKNILNDKGVVYFKNSMFDIENAIKYFFELNEEKKIVMGNANYGNLKNYSFEKIRERYSQLFEEIVDNEN